MPTELCSKCREIKSGVTLCADDRLCPDCSAENERQLAVLKNRSDGEKSMVINAKSTSSTSTRSRTNKTERAAKTKIADDPVDPSIPPSGSMIKIDGAETMSKNKRSATKTVRLTSGDLPGQSASPPLMFEAMNNDQSHENIQPVGEAEIKKFYLCHKMIVTMTALAAVPLHVTVKNKLMT